MAQHARSKPLPLCARTGTANNQRVWTSPAYSNLFRSNGISKKGIFGFRLSPLRCGSATFGGSSVEAGKAKLKNVLADVLYPCWAVPFAASASPLAMDSPLRAPAAAQVERQRPTAPFDVASPCPVPAAAEGFRPKLRDHKRHRAYPWKSLKSPSWSQDSQSAKTTIDAPINKQMPMSHHAWPIPVFRCFFLLGRISWAAANRTWAAVLGVPPASSSVPSGAAAGSVASTFPWPWSMAMRSCSVVSIGFFVSTSAPGSGEELDAWLLDCLMIH